MERTIKFRAFNGEGMEYGGFSIHATGGVITSEFGRVTTTSPIMQFTGLKDKNGVEIYESDRIAEYDGVIIYDVGSFWVDHIRGEGRMKTLLNEWINKRNKAGCGIEVIGNIHENEDLLNN